MNRSVTPATANTNKSVLITGCSSGIGRAVALALNEEFLVIAAVRKKEDRESLLSLGLKSIILDLNDIHSIEQGFNEAMTISEGSLCGLFHNGGFAQIGAIEDVPTEALIKQFQTNFFGWHHLTRLALPIMRKQNSGRIIFNSSVFGLVAGQFNGAYTATKFAIEGYVDTLRHELQISKSNIRVSLLEPGPIETNIRKNSIPSFDAYIDREASVYTKIYKAINISLHSKKWKWHLTLPSEACIKPVRHALKSANPRARYQVTIHTRLFSFFRRMLPTKIFDYVAYILNKILMKKN